MGAQPSKELTQESSLSTRVQFKSMKILSERAGTRARSSTISSGQDMPSRYLPRTLEFRGDPPKKRRLSPLADVSWDDNDEDGHDILGNAYLDPRSPTPLLKRTPIRPSPGNPVHTEIVKEGKLILEDEESDSALKLAKEDEEHMLAPITRTPVTRRTRSIKNHESKTANLAWNILSDKTNTVNNHNIMIEIPASKHPNKSGIKEQAVGAETSSFKLLKTPVARKRMSRNMSHQKENENDVDNEKPPFDILNLLGSPNSRFHSKLHTQSRRRRPNVQKHTRLGTMR